MRARIGLVVDRVIVAVVILYVVDIYWRNALDIGGSYIQRLDQSLGFDELYRALDTHH